MSANHSDSADITPQMANVIVLTVFIKAMEGVDFGMPSVPEAVNAELTKAKERFLERMRENLTYARKQLG